MKLVRNAMFETNSSSTHVLCLSRKSYNLEEDNWYNILPHSLYYMWMDQPDSEFIKELQKEDWEPVYDRFCNLDNIILDSWLDKICYMYGTSKYKREMRVKFFTRYKSWLKMMRPQAESSREFERLQILQRVFDLYAGDRVPDKTLSVDDKGDTSAAVKRILESQELFNNFVLNKNSYISLGGDEYHGFYVKKVGFSFDYSDNKAEFKKKVEEVETKDNCEIMLLNNG